MPLRADGVCGELKSADIGPLMSDDTNSGSERIDGIPRTRMIHSVNSVLRFGLFVFSAGGSREWDFEYVSRGRARASMNKMHVHPKIEWQLCGFRSERLWR